MKRITAIILLFIGQISFGQDLHHKIDSLMTSLHASGSFHGNVLVADKGKVMYQKSFGLANERTQEKLNENSIFELASVSKQFTAMGIVLLKEQGKLNYDDKMSKYLPELSFYENMTVRHLLNHTSGLPDYMEILDSVFDKSKIATNADIITAFEELQPPVLFELNERWEYSNTGYALLASIIERVSGMSYVNFLSEAIFRPLRMNNTFVHTRRYAPKEIANYAYGYMYSDSLQKYVLPDELEGMEFVVWLDGIVGDGTVNSTAGDLLKWDRALYGNEFISADAKKEVFASSETNDKTKTDYGFGWFIEDNAIYGNTVNHSGGWPGYITFIDRHIQNDKTIIVLINHVNEQTSMPVRAIRKILYNIEPIKHIELKKKEKAKFAGDYANSSGEITKLIFEKGSLYRINDQGAKNELKAITNTKFQLMLRSRDVFYEFVLNDGKVEKFILTQPEKRIVEELTRQ